jgi:hypothetical protein
MAHPDYLREKARKLRTEQGLTLDELVDRLALPKTTIYYWVRDIPLPPGRPRTIGQRKGNSSMRRKYLLLRQAAYAGGEREFECLAEDPCFRDFVCLYIAEGYKRDRNRVSIGNSDAAVVEIANTWITRFARNRVWYRVQYHADQDFEELGRFWAAVLRTTPEMIIFQRKSNSGKLNGRNWRSEHGVLTVGSNDTLFRARLGAWMDCLKRQWVALDSA